MTATTSITRPGARGIRWRKELREMRALDRISGYAHVARRYGLEEAIFLDSLMFWYRENRANGRNFRDGRWWTYNSVGAFEELFPWWSGKQRRRIAAYLKQARFAVSRSGSGLIFDIDITLKGAGHSARCRIAGHHTHVVLLERDGHPLINQPPAEEQPEAYATDRSLLNVADIVTFADETPLDGLRELLDRQVSYNMAIAQAGLDQSFGARIGQILLDAYGDTVSNRAKALAAAASDARMNGCGLPVVINSGSGNQGITASVPVVVYARELGVSQTSLYRALIVSNLITIHLKTGIGRLSAYCGAISAGCGAGSGVAYLYGGRQDRIAHTIVNALAINSGVICDGAKSSCAAKIASAVEAGLLGMQMAQHGSEFVGGDGIVIKGVENTIRNVGRLAREGMAQTDKKIIDIMLEPSGGQR